MAGLLVNQSVRLTDIQMVDNLAVLWVVYLGLLTVDMMEVPLAG